MTFFNRRHPGGRHCTPITPSRGIRLEFSVGEAACLLRPPDLAARVAAAV